MHGVCLHMYVPCMNACMLVYRRMNKVHLLSCTSVPFNNTHTNTHLPVHMAHPSADHHDILWSPVPLVNPAVQGAIPTLPTQHGPGTDPPPLQRLLRLCVLLCSVPPFNLGVATCDGGAQDEQIGLACLIAPAPLDYLSIWARKQGEKGGVTMWLYLAPGRALVPGQLAQTDSLSCSPSTNTGSLVRLTAFTLQAASFCVWS